MNGYMIPLRLPLPHGENEARALPHINYSLLSISKLCDNDCTVTFHKKAYDIYHENKHLISEPFDPKTTLLKIPIPISNGETNPHLTTSDVEATIQNMQLNKNQQF